MSFKRFKLVAIILIILVTSGNLFSGVVKEDKFEWEDITPDDWAVNTDSVQKISDAAMIFERIEYDDEDLNHEKCYVTIYRRIRILSDNGREWADVEVPFYNIDQKIDAIQGRTLLRDGTIIPLDEEQVYEKEVFKSKKLKHKQFTFSLAGVTNDCIVEYIIKYKFKYPMGVWIIQKKIPLLKGELKWKFFSERENHPYVEFMSLMDMNTPNYIWQNCTSETSVEQYPNIKEPEEIHFTIENVQPFEEESYMPPVNSRKTKLICYYGSRKAASSYWGDVGLVVGRIGDRFCENNDNLKEVIETFGEMETDKEKIETAFRWIQDSITNLAYDDYYDDNGKKKDPKENSDIDDVIKHGYGTRSDIIYTFYDMLREMNIDAKLALACDRSENIFIKDAKYWQFDATLVAVPDSNGNHTFYLPSYKFTTLDFIPWFYEGVKALLASGYQIFANTPFSGSLQNTVSKNYNLVIAENLAVSGNIEMYFTGQNARKIRIYLEDNDSLEYNTLLENKYEDVYENVTVDSFQMENYDNPYAKLIVNCRAKYPDLVLQGDRLFLNPFSFFEDAANPFFAQKRREAILFDHSYQLRESALITLPEGWVIEALPNDSIYSNKVGDCGIQFTNFGTTLNIQRYFILNSPFWPVDYYDSVKKLFQIRQDFSDMVIVLKKAEPQTVEQ